MFLMSYHIRAFCVPIKNKNIQLAVHKYMFICHVRQVFVQEKINVYCKGPQTTMLARTTTTNRKQIETVESKHAELFHLSRNHRITRFLSIR